MEFVAIFCVLALQSLTVVDGAGCNAYTGAIIRDYDFDYTTPTTINSALSGNEHPTTDTQLEVVLTDNLYTIDCSCGIITMWQFFAWRTGTVVFYVLDGNTVKGTSSFHVNEQTKFNFLEIPLSSDMWIPVRSGYRLGFYTEGEPMITYEAVTGFTSGYYSTGRSLQSVDGNVQGSGTNTNNRKYAVAAYIIAAHAPMFVNAPFTTTLYTHETGTIVYTASVLDLDGTDVLTVTKTSGNSNFVYNPSTLTYNSRLSQGTYTVSLTVSDGCNAAVSETITINLVNEGPSFTNLPASTTVDELDTATKTLYTLTATDASGDDVTCSLDNPSVGPFVLNRVSSGVYEIKQSSPSYDYTSVKFYDLRISCTDAVTTRYSNFQVDVVRNEPPFYNPGSGFLPASISVDRTSGASIYQLDFSDPENDAVTANCINCGTVPFSVSSTGEVTTTAVLGDEGYDVQITLSDGTTTVGPYVLSVVTSGRPYTFNAAPIFTNLPATIHVMEHTAVDTFLLKVLYTDENPSDTLTLAKDGATDANSDTYFNFNTTTGIITVKADVDFETTGAGGFEMVITVNDGSETQHVTTTGTVTFTIVNINEGITLTIGNPAITSDESSGRTAGTSTFSDPAISAVDVDAGDTAYYTMDCGADSKYFYLDTATLRVHFAHEYDMDAGLSGTATCNVTVRDKKGLSDTKEMTLTVNNINDHNPKFPKHNYVFLISTTTTFFTELANLAASDADSDTFGSTNGILTYSFSPASPTDLYFQINQAGVLYVRDVSTFTGNNYVFEVIAADQGGFQGTCTVTVIFTTLATTTTTTTERTIVFKDDYKNYIWLLLCAVGIFSTLVVIALMIWKDPVVNEYISFKFFKLSEWCRKKPKPKEPKRTVGKLRVTVNKKDLENDPDNALPWELLAKDNDVPEINEVQEVIQGRIERKDREYKDFSGLPVFERGRGARPESGRTTVHSSASRLSRQDSDSPKYATLMATNGKKVKEENEDGGESQWGDLTERRVTLTPVVAITPDAESDTEEPRNNSPLW